MKSINKVVRGFTLVEILIVVVILGILAAIVIPQFTDASNNARASSTMTQLQTIRSQLELYQVQHNGNYPALATIWGQLAGTTLVTGVPDANGAFGPYLQQAPTNPITGFDIAVAVGSGDADVNGWEYDETNGAIEAVGFDEANGVAE